MTAPIDEFAKATQPATIILIQTTYIHVKVGEMRFKISFKGKEAYNLMLKASGTMSFFHNHPLLLEYNEPRTTLYINSKPENGQALVAEIEAEIDKVLKGNLDWRKFLFGADKELAFHLLEKNVREGNGILVDYAPASVINAVINVCEQQGVATKFFGTITSSPDFDDKYFIFMIGQFYVIAQEFQVDAL